MRQGDIVEAVQNPAMDSPGPTIHAPSWRGAVRWLLLLPVVLVLAVFFIGPVVFNVVESLRLPNGGFGFDAYRRILTDAYFFEVGLQTLMLAAVVTVVCLVMGYPFAYAVARSSGRFKALLIFVLVAPLLVNVVVRSYGWMIVMGGGGLLDTAARALGLPTVNLMYSWTGIVIALVHVLLPFMVLSIASTLEAVDLNIEDAASVMGATPLQALWHVTIPMSIEGVVTGCIITFTLTVGSFVTVMLLGDNSTMVLPLLIYQRLTTLGDWGAAATLGIVLLVVVMSLLGLQAAFRRRKADTA